MESNYTVILENNILKVTLAGSLDAVNSPGLLEQLKAGNREKVNEIVFLARNLTYLASAGLRVILFAIQRILQPGGKVYFIGGQKDVLSVINMTGLNDSLIIQDNYPL